ncbi:MAG: D-alanine--D-alanine ligase [Proteobacteria bacterium]|nr:D-alanine--D-alanine ligase [Pseudomonadota bacterium]
MSLHVAVLMGRWSAEREVSLASGGAVVEAIRELAYDVTPIDIGRDIATVLDELRPDIVFNALHGRFGEDGCIQGVLETLRIPYTHSGVLASALAMSKPAALRVFDDAGLRCPSHAVVSRAEYCRGDVMPLPHVVKPLNEGSSVGVRIVNAGDNIDPNDLDSWTFGDHALVEQYIPGREITVAVLADQPLDVLEIKPTAGFYDYDAKYVAGGSDHVVPAPIHPDTYAEAMEASEIAHRSLGCRGITRADFRYDDTAGEPGELYILELNTQPGLTATSLVPEIAAHRGMTFPNLVSWMLEDAGCDR